MNVDIELIKLNRDFSRVGTITASVTSLDERGRSVVIIRPPAMGSVDKENVTSIDRDKFHKYYTMEDCCGFTLYEMKDYWKKQAQKHAEALELLS